MANDDEHSVSSSAEISGTIQDRLICSIAVAQSLLLEDIPSSQRM